MRFLLVDHITEWKSDSLIKGVKNIAMSEDYLEFHFPRTPVMPGVLLLEAMVQLAGWLEARASGFENWFLMRQVRKCSFYGFALPGDQVAFEVRLLSSASSRTRTYQGIGEIEGKKKIRAEFEGELMALSELEDVEEQRRLFQVLTRESSTP
jgi:3-hydroxyacyl-[acyl-carrier-protein] dehydratase